MYNSTVTANLHSQFGAEIFFAPRKVISLSLIALDQLTWPVLLWQKTGKLIRTSYVSLIDFASLAYSTWNFLNLSWYSCCSRSTSVIHYLIEPSIFGGWAITNYAPWDGNACFDPHNLLLFQSLVAGWTASWKPTRELKNTRLLNYRHSALLWHDRWSWVAAMLVLDGSSLVVNVAAAACLH